MRATAFILFVALAFAAILNIECARPKREIDCSNYRKPRPGEQISCIHVHSPVCGSDGKTYSNECFFCTEVKATDNKLKLAHWGEC